MNNELDPATVFPFAVHLQVLKHHVIETQPYMNICQAAQVSNLPRFVVL